MRTSRERQLRQYLTVADVAKSLKVTKETIRQACARGSIPCVRTPGGEGRGQFRIPAEYLDFPMRRTGGDAA